MFLFITLKVLFDLFVYSFKHWQINFAIFIFKLKIDKFHRVSDFSDKRFSTTAQEAVVFRVEGRVRFSADVRVQIVSVSRLEISYSIFTSIWTLVIEHFRRTLIHFLTLFHFYWTWFNWWISWDRSWFLININFSFK